MTKLRDDISKKFAILRGKDQTGLHSHEAQSEWFIWKYSHSDGGMFNPAELEPVGKKFHVACSF